MSDDRCEKCGRPFDRPSFYDPCKDRHLSPTLAQRIVEAIETDLCDRSGLGFDDIDDDTRGGIRDAWAELIRKQLIA